MSVQRTARDVCGTVHDESNIEVFENGEIHMCCTCWNFIELYLNNNPSYEMEMADVVHHFKTAFDTYCGHTEDGISLCPSCLCDKHNNI
uniref:Uncharacterized protein n=1 Tax=viral metagenome TaxID=1070528 RepID=A0A6C0BMD7_9ZZZZ